MQFLPCFVRSPVAYEALKRFQLTVRSTLQAHTGCFIYEGVTSLDSIAKQVELFGQFKTLQKAQGKLELLIDRVLIFGEVKVLLWNSRSQLL